MSGTDFWAKIYIDEQNCDFKSCQNRTAHINKCAIDEALWVSDRKMDECAILQTCSPSSLGMTWRWQAVRGRGRRHLDRPTVLTLQPRKKTIDGFAFDDSEKASGWVSVIVTLCKAGVPNAALQRPAAAEDDNEEPSNPTVWTLIKLLSELYKDVSYFGRSGPWY